MEKEFIAFVEKKRLFHKNDQILLAVSGGVDSVAMALLFKACGLNASIAHCNFKLRGKASDKDEQFVKALAKKLKMPFYAEQFDTKAFAEKNNINTQLAARTLRYQWLEEVRKNEKLMWIATAHHLDDSIETFFLNLLRGTGIAGLRGIPVKNGKTIRPLLFADRGKIQQYMHAQKAEFREDESNHEDFYARNRIRHHLIPFINELQPEYRKIFEGNFEKLNGEEALKNIELERWMKLHIKTLETGDQVISKQKLFKLPHAGAYLAGWLKPAGFSSAQIEAIIEHQKHQSGKQFLSDTHRLIIDRSHLILTATDSNQAMMKLIERGEDKVDFGHAVYHFEVIKPVDFAPGIDQNVAYFNLNKVEYPLVLRKWKKGDYFYPFGMKLKKKKVSDFLTDNKFSIPEKERLDILLSGKKIAWLVGFRTDERFRVNKSTQNILRVIREPKK